MLRRAVLLALALDAWGEPPARLHPVVWMGNYLKWARQQWRGQTPFLQLAEGTLTWTLGAVISAAAGQQARRLPWWAQGVLLKPLLARRALFDAVREVHSALAHDDLPEARRLLSWHLVSRDTAELSACEVAGAAIESLAENLSDSLIAPLLAYRVGGLRLAAFYRYANTADAMWGYRTPELEWAGKSAARTDDLLNLAPSRLTALCALVVAGQPKAWRVWWRDRCTTTSPNAGHPMSAFAGALGIRLDKRVVYTLNPAGRSPCAADLPRALQLAERTFGLALLVLLVKGKSRA
ncbi:cobalamin biosynthesis protein CobD (plasmid) [Deinococcus psychrotolerans]|uniref:Cobalamin biosynthesis protein CobD n=1 Tax=Deinococcus psychrotolerans TaxID=2489213 RepID=A0A3G8YJS1_9DEIO|nr:cobalamin biosynthesis protein CobD [Deinococcus psychrotolerans]